eukprot:358538-Chlamydomonas_euryale.AAC.4
MPCPRHVLVVYCHVYRQCTAATPTSAPLPPLRRTGARCILLCVPPRRAVPWRLQRACRVAACAAVDEAAALHACAVPSPQHDLRHGAARAVRRALADRGAGGRGGAVCVCVLRAVPQQSRRMDVLPGVHVCVALDLLHIHLHDAGKRARWCGLGLVGGARREGGRLQGRWGRSKGRMEVHEPFAAANGSTTTNLEGWQCLPR